MWISTPYRRIRVLEMAIGRTHGNPITILVSLSSTDPAIAFVEVRVEHHVRARAVNFVNGTTGAVAFELIEPPVKHAHVDVRDVTWHWEYRFSPHQAWHRFETTRHRLYTVLATASAPWHQAP